MDSNATTGQSVDFSRYQLSGFRIGVTSDRRSEDLIDALVRRGASVMHAPALQIAPIAEDHRLIEDTRAVLRERPDATLITTAYGMRRWAEAADAAGVGDELTQVLSQSSIIVRGPKARGAVRAAGLEDQGIAPDERTSSAVDILLDQGIAGKTVVVQLHGYADEEQLQRLRNAGAEVLTVAPYRWVRPHDGDRLARLIEAAVARQLHVVTFTSAPAVDALFSTAGELGLARDLQAAFKESVTAAAVGPVTAEPLHAWDIPTLQPQRFRMGALIRLVCESLEASRLSIDTAAGALQIRGNAVTINGESTTLAPTSLALLRALAENPGTVMTREELLGHLPENSKPHALDMAISRLRKSLPHGSVIRTVIKRGYRLQV